MAKAKSSSTLALDTEFIREKTYFPNLCLLQAATDDEVFIIDPFAVEDLTPLSELLLNENIVKLFHAGTQDLEIIKREVGCLPTPIFDVQVAAALLGQSHQAGLASIVSAFLDINIKKSDSFTDWTQRPLKDSQINYAAEDVVYLAKLYDVMVEKLKRLGRLDWLNDDFAAMIDPEKYEVRPFERYKRLKRVNQLSRKQMAAAREVAAWREEEAVRRDVPRKWILSDEQIVEACRREAKSIDDLFMVRGIRESLSMKDARTVVSKIRDALASPESSWPKLSTPSSSEPNVDSAVDLMDALLRVRAKESGVAQQSLSSRSDLTLLARGHVDQAQVAHGWRRKIAGNDLIDLLEGKIALKLKDNELVVERLQDKQE